MTCFDEWLILVNVVTWPGIIVGALMNCFSSHFSNLFWIKVSAKCINMRYGHISWWICLPLILQQAPAWAAGSVLVHRWLARVLVGLACNAACNAWMLPVAAAAAAPAPAAPPAAFGPAWAAGAGRCVMTWLGDAGGGLLSPCSPARRVVGCLQRK